MSQRHSAQPSPYVSELFCRCSKCGHADFVKVNEETTRSEIERQGKAHLLWVVIKWTWKLLAVTTAIGFVGGWVTCWLVHQ